MQGRSYTCFVQTLQDLNKHRPFSNEVDYLPRIGQPEDNFDLHSPRSSQSSSVVSENGFQRSVQSENLRVAAIGPNCILSSPN